MEPLLRLLLPDADPARALVNRLRLIESHANKAESRSPIPIRCLTILAKALPLRLGQDRTLSARILKTTTLAVYADCATHRQIPTTTTLHGTLLPLLLRSPFPLHRLRSNLQSRIRMTVTSLPILT